MEAARETTLSKSKGCAINGDREMMQWLEEKVEKKGFPNGRYYICMLLIKFQ